MELDELKKELNLKMTASEQRTAVDLASLLKRDTTSVIQKIIRSLWIELAFAICFTIGCLLATLLTDIWAYKMYFGIFIFIGLAFVIVLSFLLKKTNQFASATLPIKKNLENIISILKEYVKRYMQLGMALLPVCFAFAYWLSYHDPTRIAKPFRWDVFGYLTAYLIVLGTGMYFLTKWYLKKLYGNYINQLENHLKELEE